MLSKGKGFLFPDAGPFLLFKDADRNFHLSSVKHALDTGNDNFCGLEKKIYAV